MRRIFRPLWLLALGAAALLAYAWYHRPGLDEYQARLVPAIASSKAGTLTATWLGVTALLLRDGEHAILIDPFFSRPPGLLNMLLDRMIEPDERLIRAWLQRLGVARLDAVLVSHSHFDHAMDAGVVARLCNARLLGSESTLNIGRGAGVDASRPTRVQPGKVYELGPMRVQFIESAHAGATGGAPTGDIEEVLKTPAHYLDYKLGGTYSILVEHAQGRLLHHGSAGFVPGALAGHRADVVFLGVALIDELEPYLAETVDAVGATRVIPTHWDDFTRPLDQALVPFPVAVRLDRFFADMRRLRPALRVQTLQAGRPVSLFTATSASAD